MNIQDVINRALSDNSDITVSEVRDTPEVVDAEITKLAAALNFIGTNLEQSVPTPEEVLAQAELTQNILSSEQEKSAFIVEGATGLVSHHNQKKRMQEAGVSERLQRIHGPSAMGSVGRGIGYGLAGGALGSMVAGRAGGLAGGISGMYLSTNKNQELADNAIRAHKASKKGRKGRKKTASVEKSAVLAETATGLISHSNQRKRMREAGVSERLQKIHGPSALGSVGRGIGYGLAGGTLGSLIAGRAGGLAGGIGGLYHSTNVNQALADDAIRAHKASKKGRKGRKKTASVENDLYQAAQLGKESLLEKIAEDRINPAKISAGPADPYSGQIMPNPGAVSSEFVGSSRTPKALIDLKAQKVRARINSDMKKYVNNVGDGYNAEGHLTKFNK